MSAPLRVGRYLLFDVVASGGMADVHLGRQLGVEGFARTVAIKRLHREIARQPSFRTMILEEGRLASRVRHPNVVPPLDVVAEGSELLLVMEYVHGMALSRLLFAASEMRDRLPFAVTATILSNVLAGLHAAHEAKDEAGRPLNLVHRDVSPQNILVGVDGTTRVIDFGIAKAVTSGERTATGMLKGKLPYLSPEQLQGEQATRRTDIYATGVVLWEVLAGRRLFQGDDDGEVLQKIVSAQVPNPSALNPTVPPALDEVVRRALARSPADRFATAREAAMALEAAVDLASPTKVGAWVERVAGGSLRAVEALVAKVEAMDLSREVIHDGPGRDVSREPARDNVHDPTREVPRLSREEVIQKYGRAQSERPPAGGGLAAALPAPSGLPVPSAVPALPTAPVVAKTREIEKRPEVLPTVPIAQPARSAPVPQEKGPSTSDQHRKIEGAGSREHVEGPRSHAWGFIVLAVVLGMIIAVVALPYVLRSWFTTALRKNGVEMTIERVDVSFREIRLTEVRAQLHGVSDVNLHARGVTIGLHGIRLRALTAEDLEITSEGTYADLLAQLAEFTNGEGKRLQAMLDGFGSVTVPSARIDAKNLFGPGTNVVVENASVDMFAPLDAGEKPDGPPDLRIVGPLLSAHVNDTTFGPWSFEVEARGSTNHALLRFDPGGATPARLDVTWTDEDAVTFIAAIPPSRFRELHVARGPSPNVVPDGSRVEARGQVAISPHGRSTVGKVRVAIGDIAPFLSQSAVPDPADLTLDLTFDGGAGVPLRANGVLAFGRSDAASPIGKTPIVIGNIVGSLPRTGFVTNVQVVGQTPPLACARGGAAGIKFWVNGRLDRISEMAVRFEATGPCVPRFH